MYKGVGGSCVDCPKECNRCDAHGCLTCPNDSFLIEDNTGKRTCVQECPVGTRPSGNDHKVCVPCSRGCPSCITDFYMSYEYEVCSRCQEGEFLLGLTDCVEKCPRGWISDPVLGWCVKCSCECGECNGNRNNCTTCKGHAYL